VTIGPEHGTVGPQQVKEAAKEAAQGVGFDLLVVCGFAFDPHVAEEVKRYGKLTVLPTKMNPDLAMSDELLKKTGAGNLFMVFGEPDVDIRREKSGQIVVEIKGVDVYGKRPEFPSGMTFGLRTTMPSWVKSKEWELGVGLAGGGRYRRSGG
jgi:adenine-specific DNA-methyltransferase